MVSIGSLKKYAQQCIYLLLHQLSKIFNIPWVQGYLRLGHGAKGLLYGLIGLFVTNDILHDQPIVEGSEGVLITLGRQPFGSLILGLLSIGLLGYVLWRLIQASIDPGHSEALTIRQGLQRCGYLGSGLAYLGIARTAAKLAFGLVVDFDDTLEDVADVLFEQALGPWMLLGLGLCVVAVGLTYIYGAASGSYINDFRSDLNSEVKGWVIAIGKIGITARGVGFVLIGAYLMKAAYLVDSDSAGGIGHVFDQLDDQPLGEYWLGAIALGFIAYAVYMVVAACYRKFPTANPSTARQK